MSFHLDRRTLLKLAVLFAATIPMDRGWTMDGAPRSAPATPAQPGAANVDDRQNSYALSASSNFRAIYGDPKLKAAFLLFLQNVYHIYPEDKFHKLIDDITLERSSDKEIYLQAQQRLSEIKPILSEVRLALPALARQKAEMARQALALIGAQRKIDGYMEIGTTGRYISRLKSDIELDGDIVLVHTQAPSYSPTDIVERGGLGKIGRFVSLNDYAPVDAADIADNSLDLVTNFIGFHHSPPARRDSFVQSLHRVLRPGARLIVRDHDVNSGQMNRMVALAHDVFNMGLGTDWAVNQQEIRNFTSMEQLVRYLQQHGFKHDSRALMQSGDPTQNALMLFMKI
ncbi:MAG: class I SAM-dependent methyltransferase [Gammaproteobacteria bacterium]|nr:class I SAM-dependent methyltransferase [Gammaproteobacteria bacterium]